MSFTIFHSLPSLGKLHKYLCPGPIYSTPNAEQAVSEDALRVAVQRFVIQCWQLGEGAVDYTELISLPSIYAAKVLVDCVGEAGSRAVCCKQGSHGP